MRLAVQQLAWLHAVPRAPDPARKKLAREGSRLLQLKDKGREPRLPDCSLQYLVDFLFEVGPTGAGGFGPAPLTYQEILAWCVCMRRMLQPWEIGMIRRLSIEWCAQSERATEADCPAPFDGGITDEELRAVAFRLRAAMRGGS